MTNRLRDLYYDKYTSTHAGVSDRRRWDLQSQVLDRLPRHLEGAVIDLGCGQGALVEALLRSGFDNVIGVDISPEQVRIAHERGISQVELGDAGEVLDRHAGNIIAVTATDFLEHFTQLELAELLPRIHAALKPGGSLVARVPNAVSPFGGYIRHGDVTHESWFTSRSVKQMAANAGFQRVDVHACPPVVHGLKSAARSGIWRLYSGLFKLGLAAETGIVRGHVVTMNLVFVAVK